MNKKMNVCISGAAGKMGQEIVSVIKHNTKWNLELAIDNSPASGFRRTTPHVSEIEKHDIHLIIDFSSPELMQEILVMTKKNKIPFVSGTTGITEGNKKKLLDVSKSAPVLWSANMSIGVAVLNEAIKSLSAIRDFDFQIEEFHHNKKKDKPSGTALVLQENLKLVVKKGLPEPLSVRGGGIFGIHKIHAMSEEEILVFEHTALNRKVFARGAVKAAQWIINKKPGLYQISDVIK